MCPVRDLLYALLYNTHDVHGQRIRIRTCMRVFEDNVNFDSIV